MIETPEEREVFSAMEQSSVRKEIIRTTAQPKQEQGETVAFNVWLQECESMTMAVRHGVKFLLMPEESAVRIGTAIQNTTPQQRKPLTDGQINAIWDSLIASPDYSREMIVRAIEAAHGIKE
jgi:hypothetical protein